MYILPSSIFYIQRIYKQFLLEFQCIITEVFLPRVLFFLRFKGDKGAWQRAPKRRRPGGVRGRGVRGVRGVGARRRINQEAAAERVAAAREQTDIQLKVC